jgi:acetylglutamate kinase
MTTVIKLGGSAMENPSATEAVLRAVAEQQHRGTRLILVHGGGKPIDRAMADAGLQPVKVQGRRYTDAATLEIVVRVLKQINGELATQLNTLGGKGIALDASGQHALRGERLLLPGLDLQPIDLGFVGKVTSVETSLFDDPSTVPILASIAVGSEGMLNINADSAASAVAGAMQAESCLFLTDTPGVLKDRHDPGSLATQLTEAECLEWIASGIIDGGMIPKVEACLEALDAGAGCAVILDGRDPHSLPKWFAGEATGTRIMR